MPVRDAILTALESAPHLVLDLAAEFPREHRSTHLIAGKWSALEQLAHLARVEEMMDRRLNSILRHPGQPIVPYDPDHDRPDTLADDDWDTVGTRYGSLRAVLVTALGNVTDEIWHRPVTHPEYPRYSLHSMTRHLALHDSLHGYRIEELLACLR